MLGFSPLPGNHRQRGSVADREQTAIDLRSGASPPGNAQPVNLVKELVEALRRGGLGHGGTTRPRLTATSFGAKAHRGRTVPRHPTTLWGIWA